MSGEKRNGFLLWAIHGKAMGISGILLATVIGAKTAGAVEFDTGNPAIKARWDNTIKYSVATRTKSRSGRLVADPNLDDGDRNFDRGLVSNRLDLLSELDVSTQNFGARVSGAAWYDSEYRDSNDNDSPGTVNQFSAPGNRFTNATKRIHGDGGELLDAFVYGQSYVGESKVSVRAGKHTLLYGESLFFGSNGIAYGQAPLDIVKLVTVPSSQFKEILRPVKQLSGQVQLNPNVTVGAYFQTEWAKTRLPGVGSFLSSADFLGPGSERFFVAPGVGFIHGGDVEARDHGQGGLMVRYRPEGGDIEFGFYATRYHDKLPQFYFRPGVSTSVAGGIGTFDEVYPEDIKAFGASFSTNWGPFNVAGEASIRHNTPLVSDPVVVLAGVVADNKDNALYAVGKSAHLQLSTIYQFGPSALWTGGMFLGEVAWNRRLSIDKNAGALDPNTTRDAAALRFIFEPAYYQALPALDLMVPIGVGYGLYGKSSTVANFSPGGKGGGDISIGLKGVYEATWNFGATYVKFFGHERPTLVTNPNGVPGPQMLGFGQSLKDRDFVSLYIQRTF